jgi:uncharacterized protein DUF4339
MSTSTLWHYHKEDRGYGPVQEADIRGLLASNEIAADTLVWREGLTNWTEAQSTELFSDKPSSLPIAPPSRRKHSNAFWLFFSLAEIFNFLIFGVPLFVALVLSASDEIPTGNVPQPTNHNSIMKIIPFRVGQ